MASFASAATIPGSFHQVDCDGGGWFEEIVPHSSGRLYGRTDVGGMYRSDDHGDNWNFLSGDLPYLAAYFVQGVAVAAGNADIVYQATGTSYASSDPGRGIWKSVDGGATWTHVLTGVNFSGNDPEHFGGECIIVQPGNDNEMWAGSRGQGLWHSTNAGDLWTNVSAATFNDPNINIATIAIHPAAPDTIWISGAGGLWVSTNHGASWTKKISATIIYKVALKSDGTAFAAGVNNGTDVIYRLTAGGTATDLFPNYTAAMGYTVGSAMAMVQVLANGDLWAADLFEGTCRSTNNGANFTRMPMTLTGTLPGFVAPGTTSIEGGRNGLVQDPTNANRLFLGGGYSPFRSDDNGATWRYLNHGVGETVSYRVSFHPTDANRVWLPLADLGATAVSDGGASGASSGYIAPKFPYPDDNVMFTHRLLVSPAKVLAPGGEQATHRARVYQTTDNGATWTKLAATGLPTSDNREVIEAVASADNPDDFIVFTGAALSASEGGIYRTTNGGASFTRATGLPIGYDPGSEFYWNVSLERDATDNSVRYALLRNSGFWKSSDRGASWTKPASQPGGTFGRLRVDPITGRVWVGHAFGIEYSANAGSSWNTVSGLKSVSELDAYNGRIVVLGQMAADDADHIYFSANNGASWDEITRAGQRFANAQAVTLDPWRAGTVWISTGGRAIARFTPWTPLEIWRNTYFGNPDPTGNGAPAADPDSDGLTNLAEYGFASQPTTPSAGPWTMSVIGGRLAITFPRNTAATDLTMTVQGADNVAGPWNDLARSTAGAPFVVIADGAAVMESGSGAVRTVEARDLYLMSDPAHPRRFLRLSFSLP